MVSTNMPAKKRGRKSKKELEELNNNQNIVANDEENIVVQIEEEAGVEVEDEDVKPASKKRGRKPKGGKIIQQITPINEVREVKPNIILHLKCSLKDLNTTNLFGSNLESYAFPNTNNSHGLTYDVITNENRLNEYITQTTGNNNDCCDVDGSEYDYDDGEKKDDVREIWKKLKILEHNLHVNNVDNKKSACFWDTCEFDNPPVYIPKHYINGTYHVYGCFCSPECAVAYLWEENIDDSVKFERYQSIHYIYSKIYDYNKNIKPAPDPYYMLEKYYGNLSIQEYRSLLRNERLFLVVDKPLTRIMPELHEDNDDFIINNKIIPTNTVRLRKLQRKQTKTTILNEQFGLTHN